jgi:broad specificity phosphatase PhoE
MGRGLLLLGLAFFLGPAHAIEQEALLGKLREGGLVILIRHAETEPGLGDPAGYRLEDCASQRQLSALGRERSRKLGAFLKREGVPVDRVYTSPWCRCRDTAREAFGKS